MIADSLYPMLPIWTLYFTGAPGIIGGNFDLGFAVLFASYTDVMPSASERATLFFLATSMQYVAQAFCPPIGGWLMNLDGKGGTPEVAMMVSLATALLAAFVTIFFFPETLDKSMRARPSQNDQEFSAQEDQVQASNGVSQRSGLGEAIRDRLKKAWQDIKLGVSGAGFGNISLLAMSILCAAVGIKAMDWYGLIQYPVIKLGWTFPQVRNLPQIPIPKTDPLKASSVVSFQALVLLLNFGLLLPTYNRLGSMYFGSAAYASFAIMIGSSIVLSGGAVLVGLSNTSAAFLLGMVIYTLGEGIIVATQAYIASVIGKSYLARVMAVLSIAAAGGKAIASGLFPQVLALGLDTHIEELVGLPFFVAAGLFLIAGGCVVIVRFRMRRSSGIDGSSPSLEHEDTIEE
jgi:MFS family permease